MSQCRQASDPAAGVSDLSGSAGFTVTHSQGFAPYSACPAAWGRPLDLLFSFRRGSSPFRMFRRLSVYHKPSPIARETLPPPPECILPRSAPRKSSLRRSLPPSAGSLLHFCPDTSRLTCSRSTRCWQGACCTPPPAHHSWNRHRRHNNPHNRPNSNHH